MSKTERDYCQKEVQAMLGVTRATIYRWRRKGLIPEPYDAGPNILYWERAVLDEWYRNRNIRKARPVGVKKQQSAVQEPTSTSAGLE
jgi:predicted DNA-binding transcriptional regulator AlpA